jgi:hypothetical protein
MSEFQEAIEKAKKENPDVTLEEFVIGGWPKPPIPELRECDTVLMVIDNEIENTRQRIEGLKLLAANIDRGVYPSDPIMAYGPISKEEKWIYDMADNLIRNEERNIEILEKAKVTVKEKCK